MPSTDLLLQARAYEDKALTPTVQPQNKGSRLCEADKQKTTRALSIHQPQLPTFVSKFLCTSLSSHCSTTPCPKRREIKDKARSQRSSKEENERRQS
mmetsp:Transcript_5849/g.13861  ORF Transcript_5849/g.13861 Transcript_5849/m.13861 type:complete len:97 (+) Transcript_5849:833-1123(+)